MPPAGFIPSGSWVMNRPHRRAKASVKTDMSKEADNALLTVRGLKTYFPVGRGMFGHKQYEVVGLNAATGTITTGTKGGSSMTTANSWVFWIQQRLSVLPKTRDWIWLRWRRQLVHRYARSWIMESTSTSRARRRGRPGRLPTRSRSRRFNFDPRQMTMTISSRRSTSSISSKRETK